MTASPDEAANSVSPQVEAQVDTIDSTTVQEINEDLTVRPHSDGHVLQQVPAVTHDEPSPLPTLHVSAPASPDFLPSDGDLRASSPNSYTHTEITAGVSASDRASRRRSIMDPRNTRFSGFLTNLINRRDRDRDAESTSPLPAQGRPSSPAVMSRNTLLRNLAAAPRAVTPPPALPPPSLQELGLSLSVLTSNLSPSHFATPPTNGTFLSPHYLLLCHSQGLDVLPLTRPPAPQPYALVRRVAFKSVVIMEQRGVLVAIAGRRDGVRVYALEEVRKAVEWRMDVERGRELDRMRREDAKRGGSGSVDNIFGPASASSNLKAKNGLPLPSSSSGARKPTLPISTPPSSQLPPKTSPATRRKPTPPRPPSPPPDYEGPSSSNHRRAPRASASMISINQTASRHTSVSTIVDMPGTSRRRSSVVPESKNKRDTEKGDALQDPWAGSSDDEAINVVAAGPSGSAALDERTSSVAPRSRRQSVIGQPPNMSSTIPPAVPSPPAINRPRRPSNLDLSGTSRSQIPTAMPSPAPTLSTLRQTLSRSPQLAARGPTVMDNDQTSEGENEADGDGDAATTPTGERISFAQALLESRLPNVPPPGTRQPQHPVFISASHPIVSGDDDSVPPSGDETRLTTSSSNTPRSSAAAKAPVRKNERSKRRRWTVLDGMFSNSTAPLPDSPSASASDAPTDRRVHSPIPAVPSRPPARTPPSSISRSQSVRSATPPLSRPGHQRRASRDDATLPVIPPEPDRAHGTTSPRPSTSASNRFLPRIITNALSTRRSEEGGLAHLGRSLDSESGNKRSVTGSLYPQAAAPKLEYVKLPGTKGALMIKSVETAKKSFLAILCGDSGEKVELFAGTYRTALGLSRTFILPDSPRNLELQLQGDDLVEVFLVFSHNVFGLEPATVRVREVRIGRAERRAARRRAREARSGGSEQDPVDGDSPALGEGEDDTHVTVSVGVALPSPAPDTPAPNGTDTPVSSRINHVRRATDSGEVPSSPIEPAAPTTSVTNADDLVALAASQIGPYTTFQQLSFAPRFPLATLADECIIPPTYPSATAKQLESDDGDRMHGETNGIELSPPPGLPLPPSLPPSKWYYRDPKGVVQGPWKASLMQSWYKDGFLPLDLPVRRDTDSEYILLKDLRLQSVDPNNPFRPAPLPLAQTSTATTTISTNTAHPRESSTQPIALLHPISLLAQPRHYGPPALFFSSRGGHSTAIVDARGRSVLKGRFFWSLDEENESPPTGKLGDIKRVEAFDVNDRAIIVALRQGGLEAVDVGDALLSPADHSRAYIPDYQAPIGGVSRRGTYIWRIGAPVSTAPVSSSPDPTTALSLVRKRHNAAIVGKTPGKSDIPSLGFDDGEGNLQEEVLFLGRNEDNVYFCERNAASFRILRLAPSY